MSHAAFQPGTFIEVDDSFGQRKIVMVCGDGVAYWDTLDTEKVTPIAIHPVMNPVEVGGFVQFGQERGLQDALRHLIVFLNHKQDPRVNSDALFLMRALWSLAKRADVPGWVPSQEDLIWAVEQADEQEQRALSIHRHADQYYAQQGA